MSSIQFEKLQLNPLHCDRNPLFRLWRHPGGDWDPSPNAGSGRVDCPVEPSEYRILYLGETALIALQETRLLTEHQSGAWLFHRGRAAEYKITTYTTAVPFRAMTLDEPNASILGLDKVSLIDGIWPYQQVALQIFRAMGARVPALYWRSKHREAKGAVVAVFHEFKSDIGLTKNPAINLLDHPIIEQVSRMKTVIFD